MSDLEQAKALFEQALAAFRSERYREAAELLQRALPLAPDRVSILTNLAAALLKLERPEEALAHATRAIELNPDDAGACLNAGGALLRLNKYDAALPHLDQALRLDAAYVEAWSNRGKALNGLGRHAEALASCDRALELDAEHLEAWSNRGKALHALRHYEEALAAYERVVTRRPDDAETWSNRGDALNELRRHDEALASCDRALQLDPRLAEAWTNRGNVLTELARYDEALASHDRALALKADFATAWSNRGLTLLYLRRHAEALASFERAKTIAPDHALAHFNEGVARLSRGELERGWDEYEWRWKTGKAAPRPGIDAPVWNGARVAGTLLLWCEQGLGDQILHLSMLEEARRLAADVIVALEPRLVPLARRSFPEVRIVSCEEPLPAGPVDAWIPMGSLGKLLRRSWQDFAGARIPYLQADRSRSAGIRSQLTRRHPSVCGLSWLSQNAPFGRQKSIRLQDMLDVLRTPGIEFVDLQYGDTREERRELSSRHGLSLTHLDEIDNTRDIDGLAALIGACDSVVTISNTTAHLAGALGSRPYVMLPYSHGRFWYWHEDREDSPWYPGATLIRQPRPADWRPVFERIASELRHRSQPAA
jgi:tetratricopeptide (TPR) repeat protein